MPESIEALINEHRDIFDPPSYFNGYEIVNEDRENLMNILTLLSGGNADISDICFEDKYEFADSLEEAGYVTADLGQEFTLTEMADEINRVISKTDCNIKLSAEDVLQRDDERVKLLRQRCRYLTAHDLNEFARLVSEQGYELFQLYVDCGGYSMSLLPESKISELKKYCE